MHSQRVGALWFGYKRESLKMSRLLLEPEKFEFFGSFYVVIFKGQSSVLGES